MLSIDAAAHFAQEFRHQGHHAHARTDSGLLGEYYVQIDDERGRPLTQLHTPQDVWSFAVAHLISANCPVREPGIVPGSAGPCEIGAAALQRSARRTPGGSR